MDIKSYTRPVVYLVSTGRIVPYLALGSCIYVYTMTVLN